MSGGPGVGGGLSGIFLKSRIGEDGASAPGSRGCSGAVPPPFGASRSCSGPGRETSRGARPVLPAPGGSQGTPDAPGHRPATRRSRAPALLLPAHPGSGAPSPVVGCGRSVMPFLFIASSQGPSRTPCTNCRQLLPYAPGGCSGASRAVLGAVPPGAVPMPPRASRSLPGLLPPSHLQARPRAEPPAPDTDSHRLPP